jgi:soluble lytic murein transglycosylase-like protein
MNQRTISTHAASCLPRLAATAFICLAFGANTHVDAANTVMAFYAAPLPEATAHGEASTSLPQEIAKNLQVLSPKDADLYRAAFVDQERSDWKSADIAIANLTDRRLVGHVLADRYQRRSSNSGADLRSWLVSYGSLPEAPEIYDQARNMPGAKGSKVTHPTLADSWSGTDSYGSSLGFRPEANDNDAPTKSHCCMATINRSLRHGDPYAAKAILETELKRRAIPANELAAIQAHIATGFFYEGETAEARRLTDEVAPSQNALALWINGLAAWKQNDMEAASQSFTRLAALPNLSSWDRAAGAFWAYRALQNTGEPTKARYWLEQSAKQPRSFYGFLATQLLNRDGGWSWQMPDLNSHGIALLAGRPAGWRALALLQIGQPGLAESELHHLNPQGNHDLQEAMLALAEKARMPSLTLQLGGLATNDNGKRYDAALYPLPPWQPEQGFQVDRALMYALIRHESQFDPTAVSDRGACGLMQLMPATANLMANDNVTSRDCSDRVLNPAYNMALGQKYVKHLASQPMIGDNLLMLLAAYNGGPNKLARWMDDDTQSDPLLFIESLPAHETRDYVQQVLIYYWNYRARLGQPETSLKQLANGEWPHYALHDEAPATTLPRTKRADVEVYDIGYEVVADSQR